MSVEPAKQKPHPLTAGSQSSDEKQSLAEKRGAGIEQAPSAQHSSAHSAHQEASAPAASPSTLQKTPLYDLHLQAGGKMVAFAGYQMPVQYRLGVLKEHLHTRQKAGLFDVSHMGQFFLVPEDGRFETAAQALEALAPGDFLALKPGQQRYSQLLNAQGGIVDDLMVTRLAKPGRQHWLYLVVNAARKDIDHAVIEAGLSDLSDNVGLKRADDLALIALQGPAAAAILAQFIPEAAGLGFMQSCDPSLEGMELHVSRSGYTGEDGFEISLKAADAGAFWQRLAAVDAVEPIGLGARDSLRLEAGLCLYGHDIDETTSPVEANLAWSIGKRRREQGGFPGDRRVLQELREGPARKLVGIRPQGRAPAREGTAIHAAQTSHDNLQRQIGVITSGGFGPSVDGPVAMGYVEADFAKPGTRLTLMIRGKPHEAEVVKRPFVPHRYYRK